MPRAAPTPPPPMAEFFIGVLSGLAYDRLGCRFEVLYKLNARGNFVVALIWGNDRNLMHAPRSDGGMPTIARTMAPKEEPR